MRLGIYLKGLIRASMPMACCHVVRASASMSFLLGGIAVVESCTLTNYLVRNGLRPTSRIPAVATSFGFAVVGAGLGRRVVSSAEQDRASGLGVKSRI